MTGNGSRIRSISAITLMVCDMSRSFHFYTSLGFEVSYGGPQAGFSSLRVGDQFLNLMLDSEPTDRGRWGRVIFYVDDVDATYRTAIDSGHSPENAPRDADWGERYFHLDDPDGHRLSFARPLRSDRR